MSMLLYMIFTYYDCISTLADGKFSPRDVIQYHASSSFGRTYLSQEFGWIIYVTKSKPPQPVSFPYPCKEQRWAWAGSSAQVRERKWNHISSKWHFFWFSTIQNIKTIIWHMHNTNAISYQWAWCASVMVYSRNIKGVPWRGTTNGLLHVTLCININKCQANAANNTWQNPFSHLPCSSRMQVPYAS